METTTYGKENKMRPTRNIVKPNTGLWKPKGSVWFKKNDDSKLGSLGNSYLKSRDCKEQEALIKEDERLVKLREENKILRAEIGEQLKREND